MPKFILNHVFFPISEDYFRLCMLYTVYVFVLFFFIFRNLLTYLLYRCIDDHNKTHTHVYRRCLPFVYLFYPGSGVIPEVADLYNCLPFPISSGPTGSFSGLSERLGKTPRMYYFGVHNNLTHFTIC